MERGNKTVFTNDMIIHVENLKELTKIYLELISDYRKFTRYKVNIQKSMAFPHISNEQVKLKKIYYHLHCVCVSRSVVSNSL